MCGRNNFEFYNAKYLALQFLPCWEQHNFYLIHNEITIKKIYLSSFRCFCKLRFFLSGETKIFSCEWNFMWWTTRMFHYVLFRTVFQSTSYEIKNRNKKKCYKNIGYPWFLFTNNEMFTINYLSRAFRWNISCFNITECIIDILFMKLNIRRIIKRRYPFNSEKIKRWIRVMSTYLHALYLT